ncbi:MAG: hypothetical protein RQ745_06790 [Longimicrobiales bacterium]|nr:hypothetical protein [Longimicrobiales bacterium]
MPHPLARAFRSRTLLTLVAVTATGLLTPGPAALAAQAPDAEPPALESSHLSFLRARNLGGAFMSGRVVEVAVDPRDDRTWYVAAASGGVWKTANGGTTFEPIFDRYGSYSIGTVAVDPNNSGTVWVGTGENNAQRSVGYGDGIYTSRDAGRSFTQMGLDSTEHIARIVVDPRDSDRVLVAAQGPLWSAGGQRGIYLTEDGGTTWRRTLEVDEHTGASDLVIDPRNPDVLYASTWQRARRVWTLIDGGPGSGIWKSTDGGESWRKIESGIPGGDKGRIGLAIAPTRPDLIYAVVELPNDEGGFYASENGGESWSRRSGYSTGSPQYYQEIYVDTHDPETIYAMDTFLQVSRDGGRTWNNWGEDNKHVDNHAWWQDPEDTRHLLVGSDGGLYESFDGGETFRFFANLPLAQYYKVAVGPGAPFYRVYGGTQDNASHGVPSRTMDENGIQQSDWFVTTFGDGFGPAVDPSNPDIIYSQSQNGGLVRYDHRAGERVGIAPQESVDGPPLVWNWDSPILVSPHDPARLYYGSQILFRSDDRGDSWRAVSGDLTRGLDRNALEVMGRIWSVDAVAKNASTSQYGNATALSESPLVEGLLYVGTDDGLIQVSEDGGASWRSVDGIEGVPELTYVNDLEASLHDPDVVYAAFNAHKQGDFRPMLHVSRDRGRSWRSINGDLPERGSTYAVVQDHVEPGLLFVGTEFGIWVTRDEGDQWEKLGAGIPTVAIRDLAIQRDANDLVAASFGRGFWVVDDYSALRAIDADVLAADAHLFSPAPALLHPRRNRLGVPGFYPGDPAKAFQGASYHIDPNPAFGATFTYRLAEGLRTREAERQAAEREAADRGEDTPYPTWEAFRAEDREEDPAVVLTVRDVDGQVVRRVIGPTSAGIHRATWDLRYPGFTPVTARTSGDGNGPMVVPGRYTVELATFHRGEFTRMAGPVEFEVRDVGTYALPPADRQTILAFQEEAGELQRRVMGGSQALSEAIDHVAAMKNAVLRDPAGTPALRKEIRALELELIDAREVLNGDPTRSRRREPAMPGITSRLGNAVGGSTSSTYGPTGTHREQLEIVRSAWAALQPELERLVETAVPAMAARLEALGIRWTPGMGVPGR